MQHGLEVAAAFMAAWAQRAGGGHRRAHAGQEQKIGRREVESVVRGTGAPLPPRDEREQPVDVPPFGATAIALARGNERRTPGSRPAGGNRLAPRVHFPFDGRFRATVALLGADGGLGTGRFDVDRAR